MQFSIRGNEAAFGRFLDEDFSRVSRTEVRSFSISSS